MNRILKYTLCGAAALAAACIVTAGVRAVSEAAALQQGPTLESLREQIRKAEEEIRINNELLAKTRKESSASQTELKLIRSRIGERKKVLSSLEQQIELINGDIAEKSDNIGNLRREVETLRQQYGEMVRAAYKNYKLNNFLLFLFASESFNDATRRVYFMRRYNSVRQQKAGEIIQLCDSISGEIKELGAQREQLDSTRTGYSTELTALGKDEGQFNSTLTKLQKQESQINKKLKAQQDLISKAQKKISDIIAAQARQNAKESRTTAEDSYLAELSGRFDDNQGRIPYPITGGVITDRYGRHAHPAQPNLIVENKGVNITGDKGAAVMCVFEGAVSGIYSVPMYNTCVTVRHGEYITLYANLASVSVKTGDKLAAGQRIGRISEDSDGGDNFLHFEIWKSTTNLNPEQWLRR